MGSMRLSWDAVGICCWIWGAWWDGQEVDGTVEPVSAPPDRRECLRRGAGAPRGGSMYRGGNARTSGLRIGLHQHATDPDPGDGRGIQKPERTRGSEQEGEHSNCPRELPHRNRSKGFVNGWGSIPW